MKICKIETVNEKQIRIRDKNNHFLGKIVNGVVYIYCKRCGEFHVLDGNAVEVSSD